MNTRIAALVAALALGLAGIAQAREASNLSRGDAHFLQHAAADGLAEVELGRLAQDKALREEVKQFATRMVADHGRAGEELKELAAGKGVELPADMDAHHRRELDQLAKLSGPDFDRAYMKLMVEDHKKDLKDFARQAKSSKDPQVRDFAARTLLVIKDHALAAKGTRDLAWASKRSGERETGSPRS